MWSIPHVIILDTPAYLIALLLIMILMPLVYVVIFGSLMRQWELSRSQQRELLLQIETGYLRSRMEQTAVTERQLSIQRHDLRHRFQTLGAMPERSEYDAALQYIADSTHTLSETATLRFFSEPVLDAVFVSYFHIAASKGISIRYEPELPKELRIDVTEFSVVASNALENAIRAVENLPGEKREIFCKCISFPQFIFRVTNPCAAAVHFDESGIPIAEKNSHGIGTASIQAYCEKYHAICDYSLRNGIFTIQIIQPDMLPR